MKSYRPNRRIITNAAKGIAACAGVLAVVACNSPQVPSAAPPASSPPVGGGVETSAAPTATSRSQETGQAKPAEHPDHPGRG